MEPPGRASHPAPEPFMRRRGPFGLSVLWFGSGRESLLLDGCLAAMPELCGELFASPRPKTRKPPPDAESGYLGAWLGFGSTFPSAPWLLADLDAEFGTARLQAFWTHEGDPTTAFRDAFDTDPGAWMAGWVRRTAGDIPPGPFPTSSALIGALCVLGLAAGIAMGSARRRSVTR